MTRRMSGPPYHRDLKRMLSALLVAAALPATAAADHRVLVMDGGGQVRSVAAAPTPTLPPEPKGFRPIVRLPASRPRPRGEP